MWKGRMRWRKIRSSKRSIRKMQVRIRARGKQIKKHTEGKKRLRCRG
jgi:hypothetical protein